MMYAKGVGVSVNVAQARLWFERAAAQGDQDAQEALRQLQ
ncbi:SEL1-like repeat protein [Eikenella sp. S3360]|uniref:SEL1-like repeat protein n=1 Tax=Eikenella glucosivorans TaxID=2766967 RepID=A0ABS0NDE8_9NEIS|nr:SEL1-like repeat protein [Eikenella glucosivorans]